MPFFNNDIVASPKLKTGLLPAFCCDLFWFTFFGCQKQNLKTQSTLRMRRGRGELQ
jgi:hypothetical protein